MPTCQTCGGYVSTGRTSAWADTTSMAGCYCTGEDEMRDLDRHIEGEAWEGLMDDAPTTPERQEAEAALEAAQRRLDSAWTDALHLRACREVWEAAERLRQLAAQESAGEETR